LFFDIGEGSWRRTFVFVEMDGNGGGREGRGRKEKRDRGGVEVFLSS